MIRPLLALLAASLMCCATASAHDRCDGAGAIVEWNRIALQTTALAPFDPPRETRGIAITQAAVLDAVTSITRDRPPYVVRVAAPRGACAAAAVAAAAHATLVALYPEQRAALDERYARTLPPGTTGAPTGEAVAAAVLALRAHDGADVANGPFTPPGGPGRWIPTPPALRPALEPGWGRVTPFLLSSGDALRPPPPPALDSRRYARDYRELRIAGALDSTARTPEQTAAAKFWVATAPQLWNQAVQQLSGRLTASQSAYAFALLNLAGADAFIAAWDAKFTYQQWRPITAIRATGDPGWTPLLATPPFPDYPAAHTTFAGAAETVLTALFGDGRHRFTLTSPLDATRRDYAGFDAIADEVEDARVWGGVHWRSSSTTGRELGRRVGRVALHSLD